MKKPPVFVSPKGKKWVVQQNGVVLSEHNKKAVAMERARKEAIKDHTERIAQLRNGTIANRESYGNESRAHDTEL